MIVGIGTDLVAVARIGEALERQGERFLQKLLSDAEQAEFRDVKSNTAAWLAKRWAAKEAFGKAAGIGVSAPLTLSGIGVGHDEAGRPLFELSAEVQAFLRSKGVSKTHLSLSDEREFAVAFVVFEQGSTLP
jgi:holo-[acyl-carrier protein] synthase